MRTIGFHAGWVIGMLLINLLPGGVNAATNLMRNGDFQLPGKDNVPSQWIFSGAPARCVLEPSAAPGGFPALRIETDGRVINMTQNVAAPGGKPLLFRARVKATDAIVVTIGERAMAYSAEGDWQTIADLVRADLDTNLTVSFQLGGRAAKPAAFQISDVVLRETTPPSLPPRAFHGATTLVEKGRPAAYIVYPAGRPEYERLARDVQATVKTNCGADLPIVSDTDVTGVTPVLKEPYRDAHLIILGRLGINRALWTAYNRFLCVEDGYYPGGDGYVVRTAANVLRNGRNHLVLGGSSEIGAGKAVAAFCARIRARAPAADGTLTLPWLLETELGGACRNAFLADDELWTKSPFDPSLPKLEPGYKTVIRWYMNAMAYYWTGWDSYKQRAVGQLDQVLKDRAYTHHYIVEFFVRAYDMLDDSGVFSAAQTAGIDSLIMKNFREFLIGPDLGWMATFNPPYDAIGLRNRHSIAPWMADLTMADFLHDYFKLDGDLADIVAYRRAEKHPFFQHLVADRWQASLPPIDAGGHDSEITASFFRYALDHERYEFFERGNARRALNVAEMSPNRPLASDDHLVMGILAHYYRDGRYLMLLNVTPAPRNLFQNRYVCGVRRYTPGDELKPEDPVAFGGVRSAPIQPSCSSRLSACQFQMHRNPAIEPERAFESVSFRSGFNPRDDYLGIGGLGNYNGVITCFHARGQKLLTISASSLFGPGTDSYADLNGLSILRTDRWIDEPKPYAGAAERQWIANFLQSGGIAFTIDPFMTAAWRREVIWLEPGLYVVRDTVRALEDGAYTISIGWRPEGAPSWNGRTWIGQAADVTFRLTPLGSDLRVVQNANEYKAGTASKPIFRHEANAAFRKGQTVTGTMLLQAAAAGDRIYEAQLPAPDRLVLTSQPGTNPIAVLWGPVDHPNLKSDAQVIVLRPKRLDVMAATTCLFNGAEIVKSAQPVSVSINLESQQALRDDGGDTPRTAAIDLPDNCAQAAEGILAELLATPLPAQRAAAPAPANDRLRLPIEDVTCRWRKRWSYTGLMRPARIKTGRNFRDGIYDLGKEYSLAEIRATKQQAIWRPLPLPENLKVAGALPQGAPGPTNAAWLKIEAPFEWRPGLRTGNYGEATPMKECFQIVRPNALRARYVLGAGADALFYYDANALEARTPLKLEIADLDGDGVAEILAAPDVWPPFIRKRCQEDSVLAVLTPNGKERFQYQSDFNMQEARLLEFEKSGRKRISVLTDDLRLRVFDADGKLLRESDGYAMHQEFNAGKGRPNTRQPAGGFTMPYSVGLWQPDADGRRRTIVARYCAYTFLDGAGRFEGVLMSGDYVLARLLPQGADFNGDGREEQLCLGKWGITHISGDGNPYVADPAGSLFYPQVYRCSPTICARGFTGHVDGVPIHLFQTIPFGKDAPRYALAVRESYVGIFDARTDKWSFLWTPVVPIRAAALVEASADRLALLVATDCNLLWELAWQGRVDKLAGFRAKSFGDEVNALKTVPGSADVLVAAAQGLYLLQSFNAAARLADGGWQDVASLPDGGVAAVTDLGEIACFDKRDSEARGNYKNNGAISYKSWIDKIKRLFYTD